MKNVYYERYTKWNKDGHERISSPDGFLYIYSDKANRYYLTSVRSEDLPEEYVYFLNPPRKSGYIRTKGITDIVYQPSMFTNHAYKDDFIYIKYSGKFGHSKELSSFLKEADEYVYGNGIIDFILAAEVYSPKAADYLSIKKRMVEKYNDYVDEMMKWPHGGNLRKIEKLEDLA